jgi:ABC-type microcin C transport system permease subunit YejB
MPRILIVVAVFLSLAVPAALAAPPADKGKPDKTKGENADHPSQSTDKNAAKACKAERGTTAQSIAAFKEKYGTNANKANAFGKCVSGMAKKLEAQATEDENEAEAQAEKNAAKVCKAERGTTAQSIAAFKEKYGTNKNKANAFGKCVSKLAKAKSNS